ncbi:MAG: 23S rRNA (adenine(2503)-C(2))-methyltransferase RlmN [Rikenellaceae bacterium]
MDNSGRIKWLLGLKSSEIEDLCLSLGMARFRAKQICEWIYKKRVVTIDEMSNLPKGDRELLSRDYIVGRSLPVTERVSGDGTKKYLFKTSQGAFIESVFIPDGERGTLCISSQAGCRMGCDFCATARQGLQHSLSGGEILNQILSLPEYDRLTNIVLMGMGEPLDNMDSVLSALEVVTAKWGLAWSPRRVTLSTAGVGSQIKRLVEQCDVDIAISLHNPFSDERAAIMPIERAYPIADIIEVLKGYDFSGQRRLSFEYILMSGRNNHPRHIRELARLLNGLKCRINIIKFHRIEGSEYYSPDDEKIVRFRNELTAKGIHTTIRRSRGEDIEAACGLLSTKSM